VPAPPRPEAVNTRLSELSGPVGRWPRRAQLRCCAEALEWCCVFETCNCTFLRENSEAHKAYKQRIPRGPPALLLQARRQ
jgi:hypothetical protein